MQSLQVAAQAPGWDCSGVLASIPGVLVIALGVATLRELLRSNPSSGFGMAAIGAVMALPGLLMVAAAVLVLRLPRP